MEPSVEDIIHSLNAKRRGLKVGLQPCAYDDLAQSLRR
jgi:hypothetical protein